MATLILVKKDEPDFAVELLRWQIHPRYGWYGQVNLKKTPVLYLKSVWQVAQPEETEAIERPPRILILEE